LTDTEFVLPDINHFFKTFANNRRNKGFSNFFAHFLKLQMLCLLTFDVLNAREALHAMKHLVNLKIIHHIEKLRRLLSCTPALYRFMVAESITDIHKILAFQLCVLAVRILNNMSRNFLFKKKLEKRIGNGFLIWLRGKIKFHIYFIG
jgi:hypothetical protein